MEVGSVIPYVVYLEENKLSIFEDREKMMGDLKDFFFKTMYF